MGRDRLRGTAVAERDVFVQLYVYEEAGGSGRTSPRYQFATEFWASYEPTGGSVRDQGVAPQFESTALFGFPDGIPIPQVRAVIKMDEALYRILSVSDPRALVPGRIRQVEAVRVDREDFTLVGG